MPIQAYVANPQVTALAPSLTVANRGNVRDNELDYLTQAIRGVRCDYDQRAASQAGERAEDGTERSTYFCGGGRMSITVDCGEGKHTVCRGKGRTAYMFPQEDRDYDEPEFNCGCRCHHGGEGVPCQECEGKS